MRHHANDHPAAESVAVFKVWPADNSGASFWYPFFRRIGRNASAIEHSADESEVVIFKHALSKVMFDRFVSFAEGGDFCRRAKIIPRVVAVEAIQAVYARAFADKQTPPSVFVPGCRIFVLAWDIQVNCDSLCNCRIPICCLMEGDCEEAVLSDIFAVTAIWTLVNEPRPVNA